MKRCITLAAIMVIAMQPILVLAQMDERQPGIYTIVGDSSVLLHYTPAAVHSQSVGVMNVEVGHETYRYKGESSGTIASDSLVLVINPKKVVSVQTNTKYDAFIKNIKPSNMLIIPLTINTSKHCREYDPGQNIAGFTSKQVGIDFEWESLNENSYSIKVLDLEPGEYGIVFRLAPYGGFNYTGLFGFTIEQRGAISVDMPVIDREP